METNSPHSTKSLEVKKNYAGRLGKFYNKWKTITTDSYILQCLKGYRIPFTNKPKQTRVPKQFQFSNIEKSKTKHCIKELVFKGAIQRCKPKKGQFLSSYFLIKKPNNTFRFILNLKRLNEFITAPHFKLEDFRAVKNIIFFNSFMASVDLRDAYFVIPVYKGYRKYLRFVFEDQLYEFTCIPFGLCTAPFLFTKIMKLVIRHLRSKGFLSISYLDDFLLLGSSEEECLKNVMVTTSLLEYLGFIINYKKSNLMPNRKSKFLGFTFDSQKLKMELPSDKKDRVLESINSFRKLKFCRIRTFARLLGQLVSCCPAIRYGWLYTKRLERQKILALKNNRGNYDKKMYVNQIILEELNWWLRSIPISSNDIKIPNFNIEIYSDASKTGWGIYCNGEGSHGFWDVKEQKQDINYLELSAAYIGLKCFAQAKNNYSVLLKIDNTTAIAYINHMGGVRHKKLSDL